jgi:hypothetical protein
LGLPKKIFFIILLYVFSNINSYLLIANLEITVVEVKLKVAVGANQQTLVQLIELRGQELYPGMGSPLLALPLVPIYVMKVKCSVASIIPAPLAFPALVVYSEDFLSIIIR